MVLCIVEQPVVDVHPGYYFRIERRISRHGRNYVQNNLQFDLEQSLDESIRKNVFEVLNKQKEVIVDCIRVELGGTPTERGDIAERKKDYLVCLGA